MLALVAIVALATPQAFAQNVTNGGILEDDDTQCKQHTYQG